MVVGPTFVHLPHVIDHLQKPYEIAAQKLLGWWMWSLHRRGMSKCCDCVLHAISFCITITFQAASVPCAIVGPGTAVKLLGA